MVGFQLMPRQALGELFFQPRREQIPRRDIDGHPQAWLHRLQGTEIAQGPVDDPVSELRDHPGFLCQRNEINRRYPATLRVLPADKGFKADDLPAAEIHFGLIVEFGGAVGQGFLEVRHQGKPALIVDIVAA